MGRARLDGAAPVLRGFLRAWLGGLYVFAMRGRIGLVLLFGLPFFLRRVGDEGGGLLGSGETCAGFKTSAIVRRLCSARAATRSTARALAACVRS